MSGMLSARSKYGCLTSSERGHRRSRLHGESQTRRDLRNAGPVQRLDMGLCVGPAVRTDGCLDEVTDHPQHVRGVRAPHTGCADPGDILKRDLVIAVAEREDGAHVRGVGQNRPSAARFGPPHHVVAQLQCGTAVTPGGRQQPPQEDAGPTQHPVAILVTESQPLVDHGLQFIPPAAEVRIVAEQKERFDRGRSRIPLSSHVNYAAQSGPASWQPVDVRSSAPNPDRSSGGGPGAQLIDLPLKACERPRVRAHRVAERPRHDLEQLWWAGLESSKCRLERREQLWPTPEEADAQQGVKRLIQLLITRVAGVREALDRPDQQPVGEVNLTVTVEQVVRAGDGPGERTRMLGIRPARLLQQPGNLREIAVDARSEVGGLGQSDASVFAGRAELRGPQQPRDRSHSVTAPEMLMRNLLKQRGNPFVRLDRGFSQMPSQPLRIISPSIGQHPVRVPTLGYSSSAG